MVTSSVLRNDTALLLCLETAPALDLLGRFLFDQASPKQLLVKTRHFWRDFDEGPHAQRSFLNGEYSSCAPSALSTAEPNRQLPFNSSRGSKRLNGVRRLSTRPASSRAITV